MKQQVLCQHTRRQWGVQGDSLPFVSGPVALLPLRITAVQMCSYAPGLFMEDQRMNVNYSCKQFTLLWGKTRVNTCILINKSLFQVLNSSPVVLLVSHHYLSENAWKHTAYYGSLYTSCCHISLMLFWLIIFSILCILFCHLSLHLLYSQL